MLRRGLVKLISAEAGHLHFKVNGHDVFRNSKKEWSCCAAKLIEVKPKKRRSYLHGYETAIKGSRYQKRGCVLFRTKGQICSHIRGCQLWLEGADLKEEQP